MISHLLSSLITIYFLLIFPSSFAISLPIFNTPDFLCNSTPYPYFCKSNLPFNKPGTIKDYAKISMSQSFSNARNFHSLIQHYLNLPSTSFESTIRALEDCKFLAELNIDFISQALNATAIENDIDSDGVNDLLTLISATLTNHETCVEGLRSVGSGILNELLTPIGNGSKFYRNSLALFSDGWVPKGLRGRILKQVNLPFLENVKVRRTVVVNQDGSGQYPTISDAVNAAANNTVSSDGYYVIYVTAGVYNEYVSIPKYKKYVMIIGDGMDRTVITGNRSVVDGWTTFNSATFVVVGQGFVAVNITFQNTAGAIKHQAVALRSGADQSAFFSCRFEGYQDTLYTHSLRQFYRDCEVYGTIDYIFGNAAVVLQNCKIYSRKPLSGQFNTVTAQGRTDPNQNTGISIQNCSILAAEDLESTKSYLGRPWKEYSRVVVMQSFIDSLIDPTGWALWNGDFALSTLYYAEFDNRGGGSETSGRVTWPGFHVINATDAVAFTVSNFTQGDFWLPATKVPYVGGLM
ncbi:probable pectinesterase/pectinesterase inhibitor 20 [Euphorbia lathyris]|uniref:probable pectinesterase/pectinesterase inhibitor 20 n=1 Tax=Euphorbia lathyris TaxID=212925 RepID=UPI003314389F